MKGPNKKGREDFENAISDDLAKKFPALCQPWWRFVGVGLFFMASLDAETHFTHACMQSYFQAKSKVEFR
jgi:hypothetical protein